ncbi:CTP synthetase, partial [Candidatus Babeliales bacterium]|nr:CTP synthetase [Candidatus Babeliales bacterium]
FEKAGVLFSGIYKKENLVEIAELKKHPFMVGVQFHPEFLSTPLKPHPLFDAFMGATKKKL